MVVPASVGFVAKAKAVDAATLARQAREKARRRQRRLAILHAVFQTVRLFVKRVKPVILATTGLVFFTAAAWTVSMTLGLAVAGLACWILEWRLKP